MDFEVSSDAFGLGRSDRHLESLGKISRRWRIAGGHLLQKAGDAALPEPFSLGADDVLLDLVHWT